MNILLVLIFKSFSSRKTSMGYEFALVWKYCDDDNAGRPEQQFVQY
jgi:hypothetical protein